VADICHQYVAVSSHFTGRGSADSYQWGVCAGNDRFNVAAEFL